MADILESTILTQLMGMAVGWARFCLGAFLLWCYSLSSKDFGIALDKTHHDLVATTGDFHGTVVVVVVVVAMTTMIGMMVPHLMIRMILVLRLTSPNLLALGVMAHQAHLGPEDNKNKAGDPAHGLLDWLEQGLAMLSVVATRPEPQHSLDPLLKDRVASSVEVATRLDQALPGLPVLPSPAADTNPLVSEALHGVDKL